MEERKSAFLAEIAEQFIDIAHRAAGGTFKLRAWSDSREAVLELDSNAGDNGVLQVRAFFDTGAAETEGYAEKLSVVAEIYDRDGVTQRFEIASLFWKEKFVGGDNGLDGPADRIGSPGHKGRPSTVLAELMRQVAQSSTPWRALTVRPWAEAAIAIPAQRETRLPAASPIKPARGGKALSLEKEAAVPEQAVRPSASRVGVAPDIEGLIAILQGLPEADGMTVEHLFGGFIAAARRVTPLKEGEVVGFIGEALIELQAYQEAYLNARSPLTQIGLGLKGAALVGAFLISMGVETWTGMKAFGPLFGDWGAAIPSAFGSCVIGGGLMPLASTPGEVRGVRNLAIAWSCILSLAIATGDTAKQIRHRFPEGTELMEARGEVTRLRADKEALKERLAFARGTKASAGLAYMNARNNRPAVFKEAAGDVKSLETKQETLLPELKAAEDRETQALEADRSLYLAQSVVFLFAAVLNSVGPFFIGKYFLKLTGEHEAALKKARRRQFFRAKARLFGSQSGQRQKARVMLAALESYYVAELQRFGLAPDEIERRAKSAFGNAGKIVKGAVVEFRSAQRPRLARILDSLRSPKGLDHD